MKLLCHFLTRRRSNKKKDTNINQFASSFSHQTSSLFNKESKCTCHYFILNENESIQTKLISKSSINVEYPSDAKYILTIEDFCFWYDVRSTLLDMIDQVVAIDQTQHVILQQNSSSIMKFNSFQSNEIHRRIRRPKTSIAIQTSNDFEQRRNAKIQTNTITLFPLQKQNISSSKLFIN